jgi:hypothetical protein
MNPFDLTAFRCTESRQRPRGPWERMRTEQVSCQRPGLACFRRERLLRKGRAEHIQALLRPSLEGNTIREELHVIRERPDAVRCQRRPAHENDSGIERLARGGCACGQVLEYVRRRSARAPRTILEDRRRTVDPGQLAAVLHALECRTRGPPQDCRSRRRGAAQLKELCYGARAQVRWPR